MRGQAITEIYPDPSHGINELPRYQNSWCIEMQMTDTKRVLDSSNPAATGRKWTEDASLQEI